MQISEGRYTFIDLEIPEVSNGDIWFLNDVSILKKKRWQTLSHFLCCVCISYGCPFLARGCPYCLLFREARGKI